MTAPVESPPVRPVQEPAPLPSRIAGLNRLAHNLSWSWNRNARMLFREIDESLWHRLRHNPIRLLQLVDPTRLAQLADDAVFCARYDRAMQWLASERSDEHTWYARTFPELRGQPVAYFCAEFGVHNSVPIYSGGLGVLAGDHLKTASDLGIPLVAVCILYRQGYFDQHIRVDGWQEDSNEAIDFNAVPIVPLPGKDGEKHLVTVTTFGRDINIRVWKMQVGRVPVYLLDSDLPENHPDDRPLLSKLYSGGPAMRLRQEWLLGVGGVRALRALGIAPAAWHANEGHAAFMMVERVRELCQQGVSYTEAVKRVRNGSVFTTHTPVPAGHDHFGVNEVRQCADGYWNEMGIDADTFLRIGYMPESGPDVYHMTAASVRLSRRVNAVSRRHGIVTRRATTRLPKCTKNRVSRPIQIDDRHQFLHFGGRNEPRLDTLQLIGMRGALVATDLMLGLRQHHHAARTEHHVIVQVLRHRFVKRPGLFVNRSRGILQIVRADDRRIAPGVPAPKPALLDDRHIGDPEILAQIIGRCQTVTACANDNHVVFPLWLWAGPSSLPTRMIACGLTGHGKNGIALHRVLIPR